MAMDEGAPSSRWRWVAFGVAGGAAASFVATAPFVVLQLWTPLPYMATPRRKLVAALGVARAAAARAPTKRALRLVDLGSGDGEVVLTAARCGWEATGVELNATLWALSCARRLSLVGARGAGRARFVLGDMWRFDAVRDADAMMIFGVRPLMPLVARKLRAEARPGACVLAYRFEVPLGTGPEELDAALIYDREEMRVYQMR